LNDQRPVIRFGTVEDFAKRVQGDVFGLTLALDG